MEISWKNNLTKKYNNQLLMQVDRDIEFEKSYLIDLV